MHRIRVPILSTSLLLFPAALACTHGAPSATVEAAEEALDPASATVFGERLLLYLEYPHLVRGVPARFLAHLSVLADGAPVRTGRVTLAIGDVRLEAAAPKRDGLFLPEGSLPDAGRFAARLVVESEQASETLDLGEIVVHPDAAQARAAAEDGTGEDAPGAVPFLMEQQWRLGVLFAEARPRTLARTLRLPARVEAPEGREAIVGAPVAGRLLPPLQGAWPRTGERVEAGRVLALVEPPLGAPERAQLQALVLERELGRLAAERGVVDAQVRLRFAEEERGRLERLRAEGLGTQRELAEAQREAADAAQAMEESVRVRAALAAPASELEGGAEGMALARIPLVAPIGGRVVAAPAVLGAFVEPSATLLSLLDDARLWVVGRLFEFDLPRLVEPGAATAEFAAHPGRTFALEGEDDGRPLLGAEVDAATRTLSVRYAVDNADGALRPGMLAELVLPLERRDCLVVLPREAIVMDRGEPTAYVVLGGEEFQRRELELGLEEADWVEVVRGVEAGAWVVTRGAEVVKLAALSPTDFGPGHSH